MENENNSFLKLTSVSANNNEKKLLNSGISGHHCTGKGCVDCLNNEKISTRFQSLNDILSGGFKPNELHLISSSFDPYSYVVLAARQTGKTECHNEWLRLQLNRFKVEIVDFTKKKSKKAKYKQSSLENINSKQKKTIKPNPLIKF